MNALRFVAVTAAGVLGLATVDPADRRASLTRALLLRSAQQPWVSSALSELPGLAPVEAGRTLFQLQREGWISVDVRPHPELDAGGDVQQSVVALVERGARAAVLTDQDGLVLAYAGAVPLSTIDYMGEAAIDLSHGGMTWQLPLGEGGLRHCYRLAVSSGDTIEPMALVALVRKLARVRARSMGRVH